MADWDKSKQKVESLVDMETIIDYARQFYITFFIG